jgi:Xaa-Pro dipeptidase
MDFKGRLEQARKKMRERGVGLIYLHRGADLFYLTGISRGGPEMTDHNTYGDYVQGAYIGADDLFVLVGPRMGGSRWKAMVEDKPYIDDLRIVGESETPKKVMGEVLARFKLNGAGVMVDDRAWSHTTLLLKEHLPGCKLSLANEIISPMRMIKDADEIATMKKAGEITDKVYGEVVNYLKRGQTEVEITSEIDYQFKRHGAMYSSFVSAARFRSPKEHPGKRVLSEGDVISFDFGCVYEGYCSDFGRIVYVGDPQEKVREIHDKVMKAQAAGIEKMVDGTITAQELDRVARGIIEEAGYGPNFVHRLGHGIGVTVHEPPFLYIPDDTLLRTGMCFTVEPSIMLPQSWSARVEDVVMVTEKGGVPFSNYHKELTII